MIIFLKAVRHEQKTVVKRNHDVLHRCNGYRRIIIDYFEINGTGHRLKKIMAANLAGGRKG
jgi:hypothetical protein